MADAGHHQPPLAEHITGLVLAGGQGLRMGKEKGLALYAGEPLALRALNRLRPQVHEVALNANRALDAYRAWGDPVWTDHDPHAAAGPLAGLMCGLHHARTDWVLTVPCDVPLFPRDLAGRMAAALLQAGGHLALVSALVPEDDTPLAADAPLATAAQWQPVFCLAHRSLADDLRAYLHQGGRKVRAWMARHDAVTVPFGPPTDHPLAFANANTPDMLHALERCAPAEQH